MAKGMEMADPLRKGALKIRGNLLGYVRIE